MVRSGVTEDALPIRRSLALSNEWETAVSAKRPQASAEEFYCLRSFLFVRQWFMPRHLPLFSRCLSCLHCSACGAMLSVTVVTAPTSPDPLSSPRRRPVFSRAPSACAGKRSLGVAALQTKRTSTSETLSEGVSSTWNEWSLFDRETESQKARAQNTTQRWLRRDEVPP